MSSCLSGSSRRRFFGVLALSFVALSTPSDSQAQRGQRRARIQYDVWLVAVEPQAIEAISGRRERRRGRPATDKLPDLSRDETVRLHILESTVNPTALLNRSGPRNFRSIARLNLDASVGETAELIEGGKFTVARRDVESGSLDNSAGRPKRDLGLDLKLTAIPLPEDSLRIRVRADFSYADFSNGTRQAKFVEPALARRGIDTHVDLADGQSFLISGVLDRAPLGEALANQGLAGRGRLAMLKDDLADNPDAKFLIIVSPKTSRL